LRDWEVDDRYDEEHVQVYLWQAYRRGLLYFFYVQNVSGLFFECRAFGFGIFFTQCHPERSPKGEVEGSISESFN